MTVIFFHAGLPVPGGFIGVDVFFVISGFVITRVLVRSLVSTGRIDFRDFYARRFKRLYPALALVVTVTLALSCVSLLFISPFSGQRETAITGLAAMGMSANIALSLQTGGYFDQPAKDNPLLNTWSLSVEEQFYLIFPAALALAWMLARSSLHRDGRRALLIVVLLIGSGSLLLALVPMDSMTGLSGFYSPLPRAWEFAAGSAVAIGINQQLRHRVVFEALGLSGLTGIVLSAFILDERTRFPGPWTLLPVASTAAVLVGAAHKETLASRALSVRPLVRIGDWSYSLYLWHWPLIVFAVLAFPTFPWIGVLAALASVLPALGSFKFLEEPLRRSANLQRRGWQRLCALTLIPPLVVGGLLWLACAQGFWSPEVRSLQDAITKPHASDFETCSIQNRLASSPGNRCGWNLDAPGTPIYLIGDSTADHFAEALIGASSSLNRPLEVIITPACSFKDVFQESRVPIPWQDHRGCRAVYQDAITWLRIQRPGLVVISEINSGYRDLGAGYGSTPDSISFDQSIKSEVLDEGLVRTTEELQGRGFGVMLVQAAPDFEGQTQFFAHLCSLTEALSGGCAQSMSLDEADEFQSTERSSLVRVAARTGATLFDPRPFFCPGGLCSTVRDGVYLYKDRMHISVAASWQLAPAFVSAIEKSGH